MAGRRVALIAAVLALPMGAAAESSYQHARVRTVEPLVTLQGASESAAEEAQTNMPFLPGDRVWTDGRGRVEFDFADGALLRLDRRGKLDYDGFDEERNGQVVLRLWAGSAFLHGRGRDHSPDYVIDTPGGAAVVHGRGVYRVDVVSGEVRLSVYEGEAWLEGAERVRLRAGERAYARRGERPDGPEEFDRREGDDFARWDAELGDPESYAAAGRHEYLPEEVAPYANDFDRNGSWYFETGVGQVWRPYVSAGWQPYTNGRWAWTAYGWTWVPNEPWGWAPFHYGRWDWSTAIGWYWIPGNTWGPGWVSWSVGPDYVGWCPRGYHDRLVVGHDHGHAVPRPGVARGAWTYVRRADLAGHDLARRRVDVAAVNTQQMRVVDTAVARLGRDLTVSEGAAAVPRRARTRPTPGDTVPELRGDNTTTIPFARPRTKYESERERREREGQSQSQAQAAPRTTGETAPRLDVTPRSEAVWMRRVHPTNRLDEPRAETSPAPSEDTARRRPQPSRPEEGDREALRPWFRTLSRPRDEEQPRPQPQDQAAPRVRTEEPRVRPRDDDGTARRARPEAQATPERAPRVEPRSEPRTERVHPQQQESQPPPPPPQERSQPKERNRDGGNNGGGAVRRHDSNREN